LSPLGTAATNRPIVPALDYYYDDDDDYITSGGACFDFILLCCRDSKWIWYIHALSSHVGFVVDKVALGQVFSEYFGFPC
jgi:hypothetical protein